MFNKVKRKSKTIVLIMSLFLTISLLTNCASSSKMSSNSTSGSAPNPMVSEKTATKATKNDIVNSGSGISITQEVASSDSKSTSTAVPQVQYSAADQRKIIESENIQMETMNFDKAVNTIMQRVKQLNGYVENSNITGVNVENNGVLENRNAQLTLRLPKDSFEQFRTDVGNLGTVINDSQTGEDVTSQYYDTEAHINSLKVEEERLLEILKKTGTLKDIIDLEKQLADTRYQIESLTTNLKKLDNLVSYSTMSIGIQEVKVSKTIKPQETSLWGKVKDGFVSSIKLLITICKELAIVIAVLLPFIVIIGVIILVYVLIRKRLKKSNKKKIIEEKEIKPLTSEEKINLDESGDKKE
jgi:hypothetical protein